jgi:uncharacterized protein YoxC
MNQLIRNRIVGHRRVRAADLRPHPLNPRLHPDGQRTALRALLEEIGYARSALAYVADEHRHLADPPLTLIDGHLRREELADQEIEVEILDVTDAEARALLLSIDPLAQLAGYQQKTLDTLRHAVVTQSEAVRRLWESVEVAAAATRETLCGAQRKKAVEQTIPEQFLVLIECASEEEQVALLQRFQQEGLKCKALLS